MNRVLCFALLAVAGLSSTAQAAGVADVSAPTSFLRQYTDDLKGLHGRFVQRVVDPEGQVVEESRGEVSLSAPRQFRWEYRDPFPQLIVADGDRVWIYDPDLEQVTVRQQGNAEQQSPLLILIDPSELERQFMVEGPIDRDGVERLQLKPRVADSGMQRAELDFDGAGLRHMRLYDAIGQRTEIDFDGWERNPSFTDGWFRFDPPDGVDVVGDTGSDAEVTPLDD